LEEGSSYDVVVDDVFKYERRHWQVAYRCTD